MGKIQAADFGRVGVLLGGDSAEREVSLCSGKAIAKALSSFGVDLVEIGEKGDIEEGIKQEKIDLAFIALHGKKGENGTIQSFLEQSQIPYTGSGVDSSRLAMNKYEAKKKLLKNGILTPSFEVKWDKIESNLKSVDFPVVVKPANEGSSFGMSVVKRQEELEQAIQNAFEFDQIVLVEEFIKGRELTVGVLGEDPLPVVEIQPKTGLYDFSSKYTLGATDYLVPAPISEDLAVRIQQVALKVHQVLGCRDFSRTDFLLTQEGTFYVLELNTIPGFTQTSLLPKAAQAAGISFNELCLKILSFAYQRELMASTFIGERDGTSPKKE